MHVTKSRADGRTRLHRRIARLQQRYAAAETRASQNLHKFNALYRLYDSSFSPLFSGMSGRAMNRDDGILMMTRAAIYQVESDIQRALNAAETGDPEPPRTPDRHSRAALETAQAWLQRYGQHAPDCVLTVSPNPLIGQATCSCGLNQVAGIPVPHPRDRMQPPPMPRWWE